jgi:stage II sporulation protein D
MVALVVLLAVDLTVRLHWVEGGGRTVTLPLEHYVAGVLAGEAAGMQSLEARKAMAVAARTYGLRHRGRHRAEGFDLCDTTHCQDLRLSAITPESLEAGAATEGELLWRQGALAEALYSKNCGGWTAGGLRDPWCPRDEWRRTISEAELGGPVEIVERGGGGRVAQLWFAGRYIGGDDFQLLIGRNLGWDRLPSTWFDVARAGDQVVFTGRGHGHGRGLCQEGCARMAASGQRYRKILAFYFPGSVVGTAASGITWRSLNGERVEVFSPQPSANVVTLADQALEFAESRTGLSVRGRPRLWFYPTVAAFRDATGNAGSVAGSAEGFTIRMQPEAVLRARGVLAQTIRHELLHVVLESNTSANHPWWFREGLVVYLNRERHPDGVYRDAAARVAKLAAVHGEGALLGWWKAGLPSDAAPSGID